MNRHQKRATAARKNKISKETNKFMDHVVTRKEMATFVKHFTTIRDRLFQVELLNGALERILLEKNIFTEDELNDVYSKEVEKSHVFATIQKQEGDYETRIKLCNDNNIDVNITVIPDQIFKDEELSIEEKTKLADEYNIDKLKELLTPTDSKEI